MSTPSSKATVLYIEDNPDNIYLVERIIRLRSGIELLVATNGTKGLAAAAAHADRIRLVLLDNRLPDMTGREVLKALRAGAVTAAIPITMISGDTSRTHMAAMLELGAQDYLPKPIDLGEFLALIDRYCS
jgi:DNA-binding response OmpR family regulator